MVERVTGPTGLCVPPGGSLWNGPTGRSGASCVTASCWPEVLGLHYHRRTVPPPRPPALPGVVVVGRGVFSGWVGGWVGECGLLGE